MGLITVGKVTIPDLLQYTEKMGQAEPSRK